MNDEIGVYSPLTVLLLNLPFVEALGKNYQLQTIVFQQGTLTGTNIDRFASGIVHFMGCSYRFLLVDLFSNEQ